MMSSKCIAITISLDTIEWIILWITFFAVGWVFGDYSRYRRG